MFFISVKFVTSPLAVLTGGLNRNSEGEDLKPGPPAPQASTILSFTTPPVAFGTLYITQSKFQTITRSVYSKFNCITVKYNGTRQSIYIILEVH